MKTIRLSVNGGENLYRYEGKTLTGMPLKVEYFVKLPEARKTLGRWDSCPNFGVALSIRKASA